MVYSNVWFFYGFYDCVEWLWGEFMCGDFFFVYGNEKFKWVVVLCIGVLSCCFVWMYCGVEYDKFIRRDV